MKFNNPLVASVSGIAAAVVLMPFLVSRSTAQGPVQPPGGGPARTMQGGMQPMMGGGGSAMVADGEFLYLLQGGRVIKLKKSDLSIVAERPIRPGGGMGQPPAGGGGFGGPGRGFGGGSQGTR